jgi:hypothetical protein
MQVAAKAGSTVCHTSFSSVLLSIPATAVTDSLNLTVYLLDTAYI